MSSHVTSSSKRQQSSAAQNDTSIQDSMSRQGVAASSVLSSYELLENILHHLPARDLLLSQRVSVQFKGVIDRSQILRRALFLSPEPPRDEDIARFGEKDTPEHNELLLSYLKLSIDAEDGLLLPDYLEFQTIQGSWERMYVTQQLKGGVEVSWRPNIGYRIVTHAWSDTTAGEIIRKVRARDDTRCYVSNRVGGYEC